MRKMLAALPLLLIFAAATSGQGFSSDARQATRPIAMGKLPDDPKTESVRVKFLNQEWTPGTVTFKNGAPAMNAPLIFDEFGEKLYYQQNNMTMEFNNPIASISLLLIVKGDSAYVIYKSSFPPVHKNTEETFYEVIVDGKYELLKCRAKTINLYKEDVPEERRQDQIKEMLYARFPDGQMMEIKKDRDYLCNLPKYGERIKAIVEAKKLKLKQEKNIIELFEYLNAQ